MPSLVETEINGHRYQVGVLDVRKQLQVAKRVIAGLRSLSKQLDINQEQQPSEPEPSNEPATPVDPETQKQGLLAFVRQMLFEISDTDTEFVMSTCLGVCRRWDEMGKLWRPILASGGGIVPRDSDVTLNELLELTTQTVENNVGNFLFGSGPQQ